MPRPRRILTPNELKSHIGSPMLAESCSVVSGVPYLIVDGTRGLDALQDTALVSPVCPVIGYGPYQGNTSVVDVWAQDDDQLAQLDAAINAQPMAAATLVQLLRHNTDAGLSEALVAESLAYSTLQQSKGFRVWRDARSAQASVNRAGNRSGHTPNQPPLEQTQNPVVLTRREGTLSIALNRPQQHNAYNTQMRDELCAALHLAHTDSTITGVFLSGRGPSFCAGGDLTEFGQVDDAAEAHLSRTTRSAGYLLATLAAPTTVDLHGACIGAGIEVPAFADRLRASSDAFFQLPELGFGLVPGAGGTVSICLRVGRSRTAYMALTSARIEPHVALEWGLIDEIVE